MGNVSYDAAIHALKHLIPPIPNGSSIHDNGSGPGVVAQAIIDECPSSSLHIHGTDIDPTMVQAYSAAFAKFTNSAITIDSAVMDAEENVIAQGSLTHSFMFYVTGGLTRHLRALTGVHQTPKDGGLFIFADSPTIPHDGALNKAHEGTRGKDVDLMIKRGEIKIASHTDILVSAGFARENVQEHNVATFHSVKDLKIWIELLWS